MGRLLCEGLDFNEIWKNMIEGKSGFARSRMLDDRVEKEFWKKQALNYDNCPSLYDYLPQISQRIRVKAEEQGITNIKIDCNKSCIPGKL